MSRLETSVGKFVKNLQRARLSCTINSFHTRFLQGTSVFLQVLQELKILCKILTRVLCFFQHSCMLLAWKMQFLAIVCKVLFQNLSRKLFPNLVIKSKYILEYKLSSSMRVLDGFLLFKKFSRASTFLSVSFFFQFSTKCHANFNLFIVFEVEYRKCGTIREVEKAKLIFKSTMSTYKGFFWAVFCIFLQKLNGYTFCWYLQSIVFAVNCFTEKRYWIKLKSFIESVQFPSWKPWETAKINTS